MTTTRWIGWMTACVFAYACAIDAAWAADSSAPPQPNTSVSGDGAPPANNPKADATPKPPPTKAPPATAKSDEDKNRDFKPSEDISEDMSVAYPSDI